MDGIISSMGQGLIWGVLALGLFLTMRILDFPDMTVEGSFPFGASVSAIVIQQTQQPFLGLLAGFLAGALAGVVTGLLTTKGKSPVLLAGILVMTALYSVNLRVSGRANLSLLHDQTLPKSIAAIISLPPFYDQVLMGGVAAMMVILIFCYGLYTEVGQAFIATGDNEKMAKSLGIKTDRLKICGLALANGLVGVCGSLISQSNGYVDINMGIGVIVIGLASIIIGELVFGELSLRQRLVAVVVGSMLYRLLLFAVLKIGFNTKDLKLISAIILAICLMLPQFKEKIPGIRKLKGGVIHG